MSAVRLGRVSREQFHGTFLEAFGDYAIGVSHITEELLRIRMAKNNVDWDRSVGAFDGDRMVGFTMIGIGNWDGERAAYDAATGIVSEFRGKGLARAMFDHAMPELRDAGVTRFVLEVLQPNEPAIKAYRQTGFEITREFRVYRLSLASAPPEGGGTVEVRPVDRETVLGFESETDWLPSWENGFAAIRNIPDELVTFGAFAQGECVGVIAYTPAMKWILTLVVRRPHRRRGVGSALLHQLRRHLGDGTDTVTAANVDMADTGMRAFLEQAGFETVIDQYEMAFAIPPTADAPA